jgi:ASC-1-like (ASCH) protein
MTNIFNGYIIYVKNKEELERLKSFLSMLKEKQAENVFGASHAFKAVEKAIELYRREFE